MDGNGDLLGRNRRRLREGETGGGIFFPCDEGVTKRWAKRGGGRLRNTIFFLSSIEYRYRYRKIEEIEIPSYKVNIDAAFFANGSRQPGL